jgi:hypothetical protein
LFLDDFRTPDMVPKYQLINNEIYLKEKWVIVQNYNEFVNYITINGLPEKVSFDHDLDDAHYEIFFKNDSKIWDEYYLTKDREMTGYDAAKWLVNYIIENNLDLPEIFIHTQNQVGAINIKSIFESYKKYRDIL